MHDRDISRVVEMFAHSIVIKIVWLIRRPLKQTLIIQGYWIVIWIQAKFSTKKEFCDKRKIYLNERQTSHTRFARQKINSNNGNNYLNIIWNNWVLNKLIVYQICDYNSIKKKKNIVFILHIGHPPAQNNNINSVTNNKEKKLLLQNS